MTRRIFCRVLLVVIAIFGILVFPSVIMAQGRSQDALENAKAVQEKHTDILMARPGVAGTAVGLNDDGEYAILVLLEVPGINNIPQELERVPVRAVVTGKIVARQSTTDRWPRPVPIGVSTGHPDITAGTIGCRVTDGTNVYALSNNHVYADENLASIGDNVLQPGTYDGGVDPDDKIGTLADFEPIVFSRRARNEIDAAIALSSTDNLGTATPGGYGTPSSTIVGAFIGQQVQKFGRTTGLTTGEVTGVNATVNVGYGPGKTAKFVKQILIGPGGFSDGGDSGSLIVTNDESCNPVGLLFAGSSTTTIANRIDLVLDRFGVTVDDGSGGSPPTNSPPTADFTYTTSDLTVVFTDHSTDPDGLVAAWDWNFGDGNASTGQNPSHTYAIGGTYTVTLTITDDDGATDSVSKNVTVSDSSGGGGTMHVSSIDMWYSTAGPNYFVYTQVTVVNDSGNPVSDATVGLTTTLPDSSMVSGSGITGSDGIVTFKLKSRKTGTYKSEVINVAHASLTYDSSANIETSETLIIP